MKRGAVKLKLERILLEDIITIILIVKFVVPCVMCFFESAWIFFFLKIISPHFRESIHILSFAVN